MKNAEGYPDPTAGDAIRACGRMPTHIYNIYSVINNVAGLHGLEITGLRDKKTGKEWRREPHGKAHIGSVHRCMCANRRS